MAVAWDAGIYTQILSAFQETLAVGVPGLSAQGVYLLRLFGSIEIAACIVWWVLSDAMDELLAGMFVIGIKIGVFVLLITRMTEWSAMFADGCVWVGLHAGQQGVKVAGVVGLAITVEEFHDPGTIMLTGWKLITPIMDYMEKGALAAIWGLVTTNPGQTLVYAASGILAWLALLFMGFQMMVAWIELWVVTMLAIGLLPFGILKQTQWIGESALVAVVGAGIRLGALAAIISLVVPVMRLLQLTDAGDPGYATVFAVMGVSIVFAGLAWEIPKFMAGILVGSQGFTGQGLIRLGGTAARGAVNAVGGRT
jgi:type IV secretion system protein TrbL